MSATFTLPDLGEGLQEAEIVAWHVSEGDHVTADQPLVSVETDKAVVDIPSPHAGHIEHLLAKVGDRVKVGGKLVDFEEGPHKDAGTVMGVLPEPPPRKAEVPAANASPPKPSGNGKARAKASPAVRAMARERGIDLTTIEGTGPDGIITREDLERVAPAAASTVAAAEPLRGMRRSMAEHMAQSGAAIVSATLFDEADIEEWRASDHDVTTRLIHAIVAACAAVPLLNSSFDDKAMTVEPHPRVDLGLAVDTPDGLIVPVIRDAGSRASESLRNDVNALKAAARARTIPPASLRNPTITLSNFGMMAGMHAALVIVPPQVAIVGAGRIVEHAVPNPAGGVAFRRRLPLSVTFDHRVVTGGDAARFMKALIDALQRA
ncbi:MAG TPA: dihydrolipoamide acetyltransferase family protein [Candidatus Acidoferrales bacterium]|nr:dihydrolipoamide acetyltransferase family protein [Candidatus Acidoferrales bacterium]